MENTYYVVIETLEIMGRDLDATVKARNPDHAIVKVAKAFETACREFGYDELFVANDEITGEPKRLKYMEIGYRASLAVGDLLGTAHEDSFSEVLAGLFHKWGDGGAV